ncbi:hypothetical protein JW949_03600 [Candidatus Woesearchaeota archaeon]|nr:hypothetical protein [Candidatus Woesearchaeota archaeon]
MEIKHLIIISLIIISLFLSLPVIVKTRDIVTFNSEGIRLTKKESIYGDRNYCEYDKCSDPKCLDPEDLPKDLQDYKICFCCIAFEYEGKDNGKKIWEVEEYRLKIFYIEDEKEKEKPFFISDISTKISLPNKENVKISIDKSYTKPYYYKENYPDELKIYFERIRINYRALLSWITSKT